MARHEYVRALATYQTIQPRTALVWNEIGLAYHHLFALDLALQSYQQALLLNPRSSEALNNIGAVYFGKQEFALAERAYKAALRVNPQAATTYSNLGTAYFAEAKYKKGATAYRKAYELNPKVFAAENAIEEGSSREQRGAAEFSLAEMYASLGQTEMALTSLRKALSAGFTDRRRLLQDRELASLRESPEFHRLLAEQHLQ